MKKLLPVFAGLSLIGVGLGACGGGTPTTSVPTTSAPTTSAPTTPTTGALQAWVGTWADTEDNPPTNFGVALDAGQPKVISVYHTTGETHTVTASSWDGSHLSWTYLNSATGTSVTYDNCALQGSSSMACSWHSTNSSSGSVVLSRTG